MDNSQLPIEDMIRSGLAERFLGVFGVPLLFYNGPDVKRVANEHLKKYSRPNLYPFAVAKATSFSLTENSYRAQPLARRGIYGGASHDSLLTYKLKLVPASTAYEISFYVQDGRSAQFYGKKWLFASARKNLKMSITYGVADIDINVKLDPTFSVPQREDGTTGVKEYICLSNITVEGFMSEDLVPSQAVTALEYEAQVAALAERSGAQVFLFRKDWNNIPGPEGSTGDQKTEGI
jgi:hypothetical protein